MTPNDLLTELAALPADAALVFETDNGPIKGNYHVTEWKLTDVRSIDCGANMSTWTEASLQLLDGSGGDHMAVGKFAAILRQSIAKLDGLGASDMQVEFAHNNRGKQIYSAAVPVLEGDQVTIALSDQSAVCKPAEAFRATMFGGTGSGSRPASSCC